MQNAFEWRNFSKNIKFPLRPIILRANPGLLDASMARRKKRRRIQILLLLFTCVLFALSFCFYVYALGASHAPAGHAAAGTSSLDELPDILFVLGLPFVALILMGQFVALRQIAARMRR